jgi:ribonuclease P/MRP protein subunit POP5
MTKLIKPTLREKNRYIAFKLITKPETKFQREDMIRFTSNAALRYLGELGTSKTSLWLVDWDAEAQKGIIKVRHNETDNIKAALSLAKETTLKNQKENRITVQYITLGVSGTLKKTREKFLK